jgi:hypothetical protein
MDDKNMGVCNCGHHNIVPILIILFAISFLLENQGFLKPGAIGIIWPILVGIVGVMKLTERSCKCC